MRRHIILFSFLLAFSSIVLQALYGQEVKLVKKYKTNSRLYSSPIVNANDDVIFGGHDKNIYFFNKQKELVSTYKTDGWIHSTPTLLSNNTFIVGSYDKFIYTFSPSGELLNKFQPGGRKILPRRITGICLTHQKMLGIAIKRARIISLVL